MKPYNKIERELIDFAIDVIQQYGYDTKYRNQKGYYPGGLSTQERAFSILKEYGVVKKCDFISNKEIEVYYKLSSNL